MSCELLGYWDARVTLQKLDQIHHWQVGSPAVLPTDHQHNARTGTTMFTLGGNR